MKTVEFLIPTYNRLHPLKGMLESLMSQTSPNWCANVIIDGIDSNNCPLCFEDYPDNIVFTVSGKRYNDWGHSLREIGKQSSQSDYLILTNDDNYYTPNLIQELNPYMEQGIDFIYWDMIHSHYNYQYFKCTPAYNQIDMGAFCMKTELAKQIKLNTTFAADGEYVEDFKKKFPNATFAKINKILFIHN